MTHSAHRAFAALFLAASALAQAQGVPAKKPQLNFPPSADLHYQIRAQQKGIPLEGEAVVRWTVSPSSFSVTSSTRALLLGKVLETRSEGGIDALGLAPATFTEKRFRKEATTTTFDRNGGTIRFSGSDTPYRMRGGEQDRSSVVWQLAGMARAMPAKFRPGSEWQIVVAGSRGADRWSFKVLRQEKIDTGAGAQNAFHISRSPQPDSQEQKLDIWLAPALEWYPVKLRFSEQGDDFIEQTLTRIDRKP